MSRRLELSEFRLLNADVFLEKAADGRYNWEAAGTGKGDAGIAVAIDALQVEDSSLHYRAAAGSDLVLNVPRLEFGNPGEGEIVS